MHAEHTVAPDAAGASTRPTLTDMRNGYAELAAGALVAGDVEDATMHAMRWAELTRRQRDELSRLIEAVSAART